ncbi:maleylpyruvate isomerase family mycothiol-dependent enzyme [Phytoactinopolyspora alkaliphila]|uniref:Maleylpyruvate isomerase family mycothiol-dependent enzyme n=1 Tax=Phytoactinopolyspora alkaliphila TaxID=1783498 RepID=A0A6N9YIA3_9ACTN|nr:maleylpyruvate isomerase family mycothiol-dependent enzyme [Phytoactinopolyspora alkaliphila]NED94694.1 maleylpyruvate isomerase family mycothiol-dependent enzyme [Phytoactinopolyspora alkaliphila]
MSPEQSNPARPDDATVRTWMDAGTELFLDRTEALPTDQPAAGAAPLPGLPGWTRAHLLAHVAFNAEALQRLLSWARTGVEAPMYASPEARNTEIEQGARRPLPELVGHVRTSAADLSRALDELPEPAWDSMVRTAQGRDVPAREVVWMRTREVWIHAVDLDPAQVTFRQFPEDILEALITDVVAMFTRRGQVPGLVIEVIGSRSWVVGGGTEPSESGPAVTVRGGLADLTAWLTGRGSPDALTVRGGGSPPDLPAWL